MCVQSAVFTAKNMAEHRWRSLCLCVIDRRRLLTEYWRQTEELQRLKHSGGNAAWSVRNQRRWSVGKWETLTGNGTVTCAG
jgi:hypothetical protein